MKRINIAEILKDCPKGMELYSPLCGKCVFDRLNFGTIICKKQNTQEITFTSGGYYMLPVFDDCECMIFPSKDQRDWSKFQRPYEDGDIVATKNGQWVGITTGGKSGEPIPTYCVIKWNGDFEAYPNCKEKWRLDRFATEEEKTKLFDAIKANGYKWNPETKTLEKLIEPKFEVGDKVRHKNNHNVVFTITNIEEDSYVCGAKMAFCFDDQNNWELSPNKFDITTLIPFESKVLVRGDEYCLWKPAIFGFYNKANFYMLGGTVWKQCIPYEDNEKLLGTTGDCDEYYKTWK